MFGKIWGKCAHGVAILAQSSLLFCIYRVYTKEWCGFKSWQEIYFSPYTGTTYTVSSDNCPSFSCATSSSLLMFTAGPRGQFPRLHRSRKRLSVCSVLSCPDLWLQCSVSFVHGLEKTHHAFRKDAWCVFSKPCTKRTLHCNRRSGHLKTEHTQSLFLLRRNLGNWPRGPAVSMRNELLVAHEKLGQLPLLTVYVVPV